MGKQRNKGSPKKHMVAVSELWPETFAFHILHKNSICSLEQLIIWLTLQFFYIRKYLSSHITVASVISSSASSCSSASYSSCPTLSTPVKRRGLKWLFFTKATCVGMAHYRTAASKTRTICSREPELCLGETCSAPCYMFKCHTLPA